MGELFAKTLSRGAAKNHTELQALWRELSDSQKKAFEDQTRELRAKYNKEKHKFRESEEGQEYLARMKLVTSKRRLNTAQKCKSSQEGSVVQETPSSQEAKGSSGEIQ